jgi:glutathione S-transferase
LPFLEYDGKRLAQSMSMARYLANEFDLAGKNNVEIGAADSIVETVSEAFNPLFGLLAGMLKGGKVSEYINIKIRNLLISLFLKSDFSGYLNEDAPYYLGQIEKLIKLYGTNGYSVGSSLTYADLFIHETCQSGILKLDQTGKILDTFPLICGVIKSVESNPKISEYLKTRPQRPA